MKQFVHYGLVIFSLFWVGVLFANGQSIPFSKYNSHRDFDNDLNKVIKDSGIPAVSLAIINDGKVIYEKNYGIRSQSSQVKVTDNTVFEACSLSKSFLVYAVYKLAEKGQINLDLPVYKYLPPGPVLEYDARYKLITSRMILSHTSGLEDWRYMNDPDMMEIISNPGEQFHYSSLGYNYLAAVIESITKMTYDEYIKKLVIKPLDLHNTYTSFSRDSLGGMHPTNYAVGHNAFGKEYVKNKSLESLPSSGISTTASDYAKLILALTDSKHLSVQSSREILKPMARTSSNSSNYFYGTGFEIFTAGHDTIISHGGNNPGFKGQLLYSPTSRKGIIFLANGDQGKLITSWINNATVGLDIKDYYRQFSVDQYPSKSTDLLYVYNKTGFEAMFKEIGVYHKKHLLNENTLNQLAKLFIEEDTVAANKILNINLKYFPKSSYGYILKADLFQREELYEKAIYCYTRAKQLGFSLWDVNPDIKESLRKGTLLEKRKAQHFTLDSELLVEAEKYNTMKGIAVEATLDSIGGQNICYADPGDWITYKIDVKATGQYMVTMRLANDQAGSSFDILADEKKLSTVNVDPTGGWQKWKEKTSVVSLSAGVHSLKIYFLTGACNINWLRITKQ